jgi:uncharacterized membrane protein (UPF0182 family)
LSKIFGGTVTTMEQRPATTPGQPAPAAALPTGKPPAADTQALIREANQHYERALQLQRQGDWAGYGDEVKKLGEVLNKLAAQQR